MLQQWAALLLVATAATVVWGVAGTLNGKRLLAQHKLRHYTRRYLPTRPRARLQALLEPSDIATMVAESRFLVT